MRSSRARRARAIALGTAAAILLAACSGRGGPDGAPTVGVATTAAPVASATTPSPAVTASPLASVAATVAPAPSATIAPGTGKITDKANGFAITLPAGWREIPLDGSQTAEVEASLPSGSQLGATLEATMSSAAAKGFAMFAMDLSSKTIGAKVFSSLEIQVAAASQVPLSLMEPLVTGLLDQAPGITNVTGKIVTLPAGQAIRVTYTLTTKTSTGATVTLAGTDYVLLSSKHTYTVTFLVSSSAASDGRTEAGTIMKSFDIL